MLISVKCRASECILFHIYFPIGWRKYDEYIYQPENTSQSPGPKQTNAVDEENKTNTMNFQKKKNITTQSRQNAPQNKTIRNILSTIKVVVITSNRLHPVVPFDEKVVYIATNGFRLYVDIIANQEKSAICE